eukprot:15327595-Ditylum_brightwellii.AAC.1
MAGACTPALHVYNIYICTVGICDGTAGACDLTSVLSFASFVQHPVLGPDSWVRTAGRLGCGDRGDRL